LFDLKTSQNDENSVRLSTNHLPNQSDISKESSHDEENNPPSLLQEMSYEFNSTSAGRAASTMAKIATNKMSELLSKYNYFLNFYLINLNSITKNSIHSSSDTISIR
jgi:hypothetical protein